jgi:hypothetical protein
VGVDGVGDQRCSTERSTALCAAWWNTTSQPCIASRTSVVVGDRADHEARAAFTFSSEAGIEVVEHDDLVAPADERVDECEPMKPAPPVPALSSGAIAHRAGR